jgi:hypothetical protein
VESADRPVSPSPGPPDPPSKEKEHRPRLPIRTIVVIAAMTVLFLCLGLAGAGYVLYDRATKIDRSSPELVVEKYVNALFDDRDNARAQLLECSGSSGRQQLRQFLEQVKNREKEFSIHIEVNTANYEISTNGSASSVSVDLRIDVPEADGRPSRSTQRWQFDLRRTDGWRVCASRRMI